MNHINIKFQLFTLIILLSSHFIFGQESSLNTLWDKVDNKPIAYATIKGLENYTISNEDGVFEFQKTEGKITIQSVVYESLEVDFEDLKVKDTIFMTPLTYKLDEVVIDKDGLYIQMLKTVLTEYALEPHKEKFFLRAVIRKNNELYKIVDFSGFIEKQALLDISSKPMPKKNYKVQIENIRKVGIENRNIDFRLFSFKEFLTSTVTIALNREEFNISYEISSDKRSRKIILDPKNKENTFTSGYYTLNDDNTFGEVNIIYSNKNEAFNKVKNSKYRTVSLHRKSNFERNLITDQLQLNKATLQAKTEVYEDNIKDVFVCNYVYYAMPIDNSETIKNNINLDKDMFDLNGDYNSEYWKNHEILTLTNEMQEFVNKVNVSGKNSEFRTKSNMD